MKLKSKQVQVKWYMNMFVTKRGFESFTFVVEKKINEIKNSRRERCEVFYVVYFSTTHNNIVDNIERKNPRLCLSHR